MMGVAGILGGALLSAIHGATVINTLYQDGGAYTTFLMRQDYLLFYLALGHYNITFQLTFIKLTAPI